MSYEYSEDGLIEQATQDVLEELEANWLVEGNGLGAIENIKKFKIHKKFTELGWFEIRISH